MEPALQGPRRTSKPPAACTTTRVWAFRDVTAASGLTQTGWGQGVCAGDFDNDGFTDLFVTYFGHDVLYRNLGGGRFEDVTAKSGLPVTGAPRWGTGCAFLDYDRDGYLDL